MDGNDLGCEGFVSMVESLCLQADEDAFYRQAEKERKLAELVAEKEAKVAEERKTHLVPPCEPAPLTLFNIALF